MTRTERVSIIREILDWISKLSKQEKQDTLDSIRLDLNVPRAYRANPSIIRKALSLAD